MSSLVRSALAALSLALVAPAPVHAQSVPFVRTASAPVEPCPALTPAQVDDRARVQARQLRDAAAASALAGDVAAARDQLRRAVRLDPSDPDLAYRLGRAAEDGRDIPEARAAYCRFRALATAASDVAEAEARLLALEGAAEAAGAGGSAESADPAARHFRAGVALASSGDLSGAEGEFTAALALHPTHAATLLDRAAVRTALGRTDPALDDLERYSSAVPAPLEAALAAREVLRSGRRDPSAVALAGIVPGGAQFATGRPVSGALVAAIAIAGAAIALESRTVERERTFEDPFGNPYTDVVTVKEYPRRAVGLSVSVAALVGGALEGFFRASGDRRALERLRVQTRASIQGGMASDASLP